MISNLGLSVSADEPIPHRGGYGIRPPTGLRKALNSPTTPDLKCSAYAVQPNRHTKNTRYSGISAPKFKN